jgi:hypothetical protein
VAPLAPPETPGRGIENYILLRRKPPTAGHPSRISPSPRATTCEHRDAFIIGRNRSSMHRGTARYAHFLDIDVAVPGRFRERFRAMRTPSEVHYIPERFEIPPDCWKLLFTLTRFLSPPSPHPRFRDNAGGERKRTSESSPHWGGAGEERGSAQDHFAKKRSLRRLSVVVARRVWNRCGTSSERPAAAKTQRLVV